MNSKKRKKKKKHTPVLSCPVEPLPIRLRGPQLRQLRQREKEETLTLQTRGSNKEEQTFTTANSRNSAYHQSLYQAKDKDKSDKTKCTIYIADVPLWKTSIC